MTDTRDGITAWVGGGLGNQLFMLAAAWEQASRLACPLYVDNSYFSVNTLHPYGLDPLAVPAVLLTRDQSPWRTVRIRPGRHVPMPRRLPVRIYLERSPDRYSPKINQVRRGTTLVGYFQSPRYFPTVRPDLLDCLWGAPETPAETAAIADFAARPAITLHLRRGDFLHAREAFRGLATVTYARRAISLLRRAGFDQPVRVFTDSVDRVRQEFGDAVDDLEFVEKHLSLSPIATLKAMASGTAMIMSNSSFSWWAAALMRSQPGNDGIVVAPRPWLGTGESGADLLEPDWVTLDAR
jgi:hypothetical protein